MSSVPKLTYFAFPGRAGPIRLAFKAGKVEFEDEHVGHADFPAKVASGAFPYNAVPVIEIDGQVYAQSNAILRFAGKKAGLYPECPVQALLVDEAMDTVEEGLALLLPSMKENESEKKLAMRAELVDGKLTVLLNQLDARVGLNAESAFVVGTTPTIGDLKIFGMTSSLTAGHLDGISTDIVSATSNPNLHALHEAVAAWAAELDA